MNSLSDHNILKVWETGYYQHPIDRALTMLAFAYPEITQERLSRLTIGQRDTFLLDLYERVFGSNLNAFSRCPQCTERLEFTISTMDIRTPSDPVSGSEHNLELIEENIKISFRLPDSRDLAAIAGCSDIQSARDLLIKRCIVQASCNGVPLDNKELSATAVAKLAACMAETEPQADVLLDLYCPVCSHQWQMVFDIASYLWEKISAHVGRLLREVHILASAYGWKEADILSMSPVRRQIYLEMVI